MQQVFNEYPPLYGTDDILYHIGRYLELIANKPTQDNKDIIDGLKTLISNDENLQNLLRGVSGDTIQNYGGSLVKNSALDLGNTQGWTGVLLGDNTNHFFNSIKVAGYAECTNKIQVVLDRLYRIEYYYKIDGNTLSQEHGGVCLNGFDAQGVILGLNERVYPVGEQNWATTNSPVFIKKVVYAGGYGNLAMNFKQNSKFVSPAIFKINGDYIQINALIIQKVDLGEPVPYTLPFLPKGQIVYDAATYETGIYNGSTVIWNIANGV